MNAYQAGYSTNYAQQGRMNSLPRNYHNNQMDRYPDDQLQEHIDVDELEPKSTCCRSFVGHPKRVAVALIFLGSWAVITQIIAIVLGSFLCAAATGLWAGLLYIFIGSFGISYSNKRTRPLLLTYTILSHIGIFLSFLLLVISIVGIKEDWKLTDGCGSFGWRRWFDSGCVKPQAKIGMHFSLVSCALVGIILNIYTSVGCWYFLGKCGQPEDSNSKKSSVPYIWAPNLERNGTLERKPPRTIYVGTQKTDKKNRKGSSTSQKSVENAETQQQLLAGREMPPQQFVIPYASQDPYPVTVDQPFAPQPYMQLSSTPLHQRPMESDF